MKRSIRHTIINIMMIIMVSCTPNVLLFIGQSSSVHLAFKEQGIVLDVGDVVKDRDEGECGTA